jgi:hypothetical protein
MVFPVPYLGAVGAIFNPNFHWTLFTTSFARARSLGGLKISEERVELPDGAVLEIVTWPRLAQLTPDCPNGLKYRLYFGRLSKSRVLYDNESGSRLFD